ncbi:hypothetical protein CCB81_12955 [Armatimonadetes bacterium Uphvl-Ar2]|nr:hypothetical protein CCB81_12955 [Armatimonadetes bacterium Uphvl-Ar2]
MVGYTEKYEEAVEHLRAGAFDRARQLFYEIYLEYNEPLALLRVSQLDFVFGNFESMQFPNRLKPEDAWIKLGIYRAALLGLESELIEWLSLSDKISTSKKIKAFLTACQKLSIVKDSTIANRSASQEVLRIEKMITNREYWKLLEGSVLIEDFSHYRHS